MSTGDFSVMDVSGWSVALTEPRGTEEKIWLTEPADGNAPGRRWLYKPNTITEKMHEQGERWSEKIASEVAYALGIPHARTELAIRHGEQGMISLDLAPSPLQLFTGSILLSGLVENYRPGSSKVPGRPGHSLPNIRLALRSCVQPPNAALPPELDAFDVFAGYLVLDGLIGNRDRHDENWAVLQPPERDRPVMLCGSYDHASSLGFNLLDTKRRQLLEEGRVPEWVAKGTAYRFEHTRPPGPPTLVEHAHAALRMAPRAHSHWLDRLSEVRFEELASSVLRVPGMSDTARTFATEVLDQNRKRLLTWLP